MLTGKAIQILIPDGDFHHITLKMIITEPGCNTLCQKIYNNRHIRFIYQISGSGGAVPNAFNGSGSIFHADRSLIFAIGKSIKYISHSSKSAAQNPRICFCQMPDGADSIIVQLSLCGRTDKEQIFRRKGPDNMPVIFSADFSNGVWFLIVGTEFSKNFIPGNADTDSNSQLKLNPAADFRRNGHPIALQGTAVRHIQPALIYPEGFLLIGIFSIDFMCQPGKTQIQIHARRNKLNLRTDLPGLPECHASLYSRFLRQLILRQNNAVSGFRIAPDSERPAAQLRMMKKLNAGITVIHIRVEYHPVHSSTSFSYFPHNSAIFSTIIP